LFSIISRPLRSTLFPYTTLFRSCYENGCRTGAMSKIIWPWVNLEKREVNLPPGIVKNRKPLIVPLSQELAAMLRKKCQTNGRVRSEEHTSELQSRENLVCRLLLE